MRMEVEKGVIRAMVSTVTTIGMAMSTPAIGMAIRGADTEV